MTNKPRGRPPHDEILTPAEWRVLHAAQHGMSKRVIANRLNVSQDAIKFHLRNIRDKLGVETKRDLEKFLVSSPGTGNVNTPTGNAGEDLVNGHAVSGIGQVSRSVRNLEQSANWFEVVLEIPRLYTFDTMAFFDCGGTRLMLTTDAPFNDNESILYFRVPDITAHYKTLLEKGVEFTHVPHRIHRHEDGIEEWMAFFTDPDGRPVALMSQVAGG